MKAKNNPRENGQAIVLIAFSLIVLVAMAGLAIDGGMVYSDRRHAQNAADSGALAGAGAAALSMENNHVFYSSFTCGSSGVNAAIAQAETAAENLMLANEYTSADVSVTTDCQVTDDYFAEKYIDITTHITRTTQTFLIRVVYSGDVVQTVTATTRVKPRAPLAFGHAIVGLNPGDGSCAANVEGVKLGGTGNLHIIGGGVWSQGCLAVIGDCSVDVEDGGISFGGGSHGSCGDITPAPTHQNEILPEDSYLVDPPNCSATNAVSRTDITLHNNQTLDLNATYPGKHLICLTESGNAIQITGGTLSGKGYTIYLQNSGDISINGGVIRLEAPGVDPDPYPGLPGVLFYVPNTSVININGGSDSSYLGLIYAPKSDISIEGSGDIGPTMNTQVIGYNVSLLGSATIDINFDTTWNYSRPTSVDLQK